MSWNNGYERRKFEEEQKRLAARYRAAGMSEEDIRRMYDYDLAEFNSTRRFFEHNQQLPPPPFEDDDIIDKSPLNDRFLERVSETMEQSTEKSRYWWVEELENGKLVENVRGLSADDMELLTRYAILDYTQGELALIYGISQKNICKKLQRIKKRLQTGV